MSVSLCPSHNMGDEDYHKTPPLGSPSPRPSTGEDSLSGCTSLPRFGSFAVTFQIQTTSSRIWCICQANIWSIRTRIQNRTCSTKKVYLHQHCTIIHRSIYNGNKKKKKIYKSKHYITSGKKNLPIQAVNGERMIWIQLTLPFCKMSPWVILEVMNSTHIKGTDILFSLLSSHI